MAKSNNSLNYSNEEKQFVSNLINDASNQRNNQYKFIALLTVTRYNAFSKAGMLVGEKGAEVFHGPQANSISDYMKKSIIKFMVSEGYESKVETYVSKCFSQVHEKAFALNMAVKNGGKHRLLDVAKIRDAIESEKPSIIIDITSDKKETVQGDPKKYAGSVSSKRYTLNKTTGELVADKEGKLLVVKTSPVTNADKVNNKTQAEEFIAHWQAQANNASAKVTAMQARLRTDAKGAVRLYKS